MEAKLALQTSTRQYSIIIKHYHCDIGMFVFAEFLHVIKDAKQNITFCGINFHHHSDLAKKEIDTYGTRLDHCYCMQNSHNQAVMNCSGALFSY